MATRPIANPLRASIARGRPVIGPLLSDVPSSPDLVEFLGVAGFDFVTVDAEHAAVAPGTCRELVRAAETAGICVLVRVPSADPAPILAFLDLGVQGVILAHCDSGADAADLVRAAKYPPLGSRGAGRGRAGRFGINGLDARQYLESANRETMCIALIEDRRGAEDVANILGIDGIDGCFVGPGDLALSLGVDHYVRGQSDPEVAGLVDRVVNQTRTANKLLMATAGTGTEARTWIDRGARIISVQFARFMAGACADYLRTARADVLP